MKETARASDRNQNAEVVSEEQVEQRDEQQRARVGWLLDVYDGQVIVNGSPQLIKAALEGMGLAYVLEQDVKEHIDGGRLQPVLMDWCPTLMGYHLYYPSRRPSPAFAVVIEALRYGT